MCILQLCSEKIGIGWSKGLQQQQGQFYHNDDQMLVCAAGGSACMGEPLAMHKCLTWPPDLDAGIHSARIPIVF